MTIKEYPQGWIAVDISEANENWAKAKRAERDQQYTNIFQGDATDERWVGDLGEFVFDKWLRQHSVRAVFQSSHL